MIKPNIKAEKLYYRAEFNNHMDLQRKKKLLHINISAIVMILSSVMMVYLGTLTL